MLYETYRPTYHLKVLLFCFSLGLHIFHEYVQHNHLRCLMWEKYFLKISFIKHKCLWHDKLIIPWNISLHVPCKYYKIESNINRKQYYSINAFKNIEHESRLYHLQYKGSCYVDIHNQDYTKKKKKLIRKKLFWRT